MSGHLSHLGEGRAISIETFRRAIAEVDMDYDLSLVQPEYFLHCAPTESSKREADELLQFGLITRGEHDLAHKAIEEARAVA